MGYFHTSEPTCQRRGGCTDSLSAVKLKPIDVLVLKVFLRTPWIELATFSKAGIVKRGIDWKQAEVVCRAYGLPLNSFVMRRLEICQNTILKQEAIRIEHLEKT